jgi:hypothetical protein
MRSHTSDPDGLACEIPHLELLEQLSAVGRQRFSVALVDDVELGLELVGSSSQLVDRDDQRRTGDDAPTPVEDSRQLREGAEVVVRVPPFGDPADTCRFLLLVQADRDLRAARARRGSNGAWLREPTVRAPLACGPSGERPARGRPRRHGGHALRVSPLWSCQDGTTNTGRWARSTTWWEMLLLTSSPALPSARVPRTISAASTLSA